MKRCIFHVDVNSAFLSWSAVKKLKEDPSAVDLRTIPSAVGGDVKTRHGIITAKSIPAGRMGVKTGEPVVKALAKCPDLILIPSDFETYRAYSRAFIGILEKYAPVIEQVSEQLGDKVKFYTVDVDDAPELAGEFGINSVPSVLLLKNGRLVDQSVGFRPGPALKSWIEGNL